MDYGASNGRHLTLLAGNLSYRGLIIWNLVLEGLATSERPSKDQSPSVAITHTTISMTAGHNNLALTDDGLAWGGSRFFRGVGGLSSVDLISWPIGISEFNGCGPL